MDSRMNKYHDDEAKMSRVTRHEELYRDINNTAINDYKVKSNATVLGNQDDEIDIEKIKKILDTRYKDAPKRRSIRLEKDEEEISIVPESTTKEYDINTFLAKAKDDKEETYEEARAKKLRDTQFDILNNLNLDETLKTEEENEEQEEGEDKDLLNLINTITINEVKQNKNEKKQAEVKIADEDVDINSDADPLDILTDLKGSENTEVFEGLKEEIANIEQTSKILNNLNDDVKEKEKIEKQEEKIDNTFYTTTNLFKKKDLVNDEYIDNEKMSWGIKILLVILIVAFLFGLFIFLKTFLNF